MNHSTIAGILSVVTVTAIVCVFMATRYHNNTAADKNVTDIVEAEHVTDVTKTENATMATEAYIYNNTSPPAVPVDCVLYYDIHRIQQDNTTSLQRDKIKEVCYKIRKMSTFLNIGLCYLKNKDTLRNL